MQNKDDVMVSSQTNVASECCLPGPIDELYLRFVEAGFIEDKLPDTEGFLPSDVTSGHVYGTVGIRNRVNEIATAAFGRDRPYSDQHARNLMKEGNVLAKCELLARDIPKIAEPKLEARIQKIFRSKPRRNRKN